MGIYKRKQTSKKTTKLAFDQESDQEKKRKKERKHAVDQESDQEKKKRTITVKKKKEKKNTLSTKKATKKKKKTFLFFLFVFLVGFLVESVFSFYFSCFLVFFYNFSPQN